MKVLSLCVLALVVASASAATVTEEDGLVELFDAVPVLTPGNEAMMLLEIGLESEEAHNCTAGYCPYKDGVCCPGGKFCCEHSQTCGGTAQNPKCSQTDQQKALALAKAKMKQEADHEIQHAQSLVAKKEQGQKAKAEAEAKNRAEQVQKQKNTQKEAAEKAKAQAEEQKQKNDKQKDEQEGKSREAQSKAEQSTKKQAAEARSKQTLIRSSNFQPKAQTQLASAALLKRPNSYTYMFWVHPSGTHGGWSQLFKKGVSTRERAPAVWFYPGKTRLHIRSSTRKHWNQGCDPGQQLPMNQWTHVAFSHKENDMRVYYNGRQVCHVRIPAPLTNSKPLYGSQGHPAPTWMSDFRYFPRVATQAEVVAAYKAKRYQKVQSHVVSLRPSYWRPHKGHVIRQHSQLPQSSSYSYAFWVMPMGRHPGWTSILKKGSHSSHRAPAFFVYPYQTRLHIVSGTSINPGQQLPLWQWTHVALTHTSGALRIYYNGKQVGHRSTGAPPRNTGALYSSDPHYHGSPWQLKDLKYSTTVLSAAQIAQLAASRPDINHVPRGLIMRSSPYRPSRGMRLATSGQIKFSHAYTYMFWLKRTGTVGGWSNLLHHGNSNGHRSPAIWFYPGRGRLHIRQAIPGSSNWGQDPGHEMPMNHWMHICVRHFHGFSQTYYSMAVRASSSPRYPYWYGGNVYSGDPWYAAGHAQMSDVRYYDVALSRSMVQAIYNKRLHK